MGVSDEAVRAAQGKMIAQITNPEAWPPGYADGFNDAAKLCFEEIPAALLAALPHMQPAGEAVAWKDRARDMLNRLNTMQPPNVVLQQVTMLGEARSIIEAALASTQPAPVDVRLHEISAFDEMADRVDALISAQPSATPFQGEG